jgi:hypothetical protein
MKAVVYLNSKRLNPLSRREKNQKQFQAQKNQRRIGKETPYTVQRFKRNEKTLKLQLNPAL